MEPNHDGLGKRMHEDQSCREGYADHDWADYALGSLSPSISSAMERHRVECAACRQRYAAWRSLLSEYPGPGNDESRSGLAAAVTGTYPDDRIRRKLAAAAARRGGRRRLLKRRTWAFGLASAICIFVLVAYSLRHTGPAELASFDHYVADQAPEAMTVMRAADSSQYRLVSNAAGRGLERSEGYLWLNADISEALLLMDGLPLLDEADYQAWAVNGPHHDSLGVLTMSGSRGHLHVRTLMLRGADSIAISAEPKGGSASPTTEETVLMLLNALR